MEFFFLTVMLVKSLLCFTVLTMTKLHWLNHSATVSNSVCFSIDQKVVILEPVDSDCNFCSLHQPDHCTKFIQKGSLANTSDTIQFMKHNAVWGSDWMDHTSHFFFLVCFTFFGRNTMNLAVRTPFKYR